MARKGGKDRGIMQRKGRKGWWVRLYLDGRQKWFKADTKSQAKALYGRLKAEHREGKYFEKPKPIPFRDVAREYLFHVEARRRRKGDDQARISRWFTAIGNQDIKTITPRQIEAALTELQAEGKKPATIVRYLAVLKAVLNRARRHGLITTNPALMVHKPKANNVLVRYLTREQQSTLLDALPEPAEGGVRGREIDEGVHGPVEFR